MEPLTSCAVLLQVSKMERETKKKKSAGGHIRDYVLCLAIIVTLNIVIFHAGLYRYICKPDSYAGNVYGRLTIFERLEDKTEAPPIVIMGDSTIEDGVSASQLAEGLREPVANIAMPATGPLVWLHYFRSVDPDRTRFGTIVILITPQDVRTIPHEEGIQSLIAVSPPHVFWDYLSSFPDPWSKLSYYYSGLDRMYAFRRDLRDLMVSPKRLMTISSSRNASLVKLEKWPGEQQDVCDVQVGNSARRVLNWGSLNDSARREIVRKTLIRTYRLKQSPDVTGFLEPVDRIVRYYEGSPVKILIVSFPFGMKHQVNPANPILNQYFARLQNLDSSTMVAHWDATQLSLFKDCRNYYDFRHLNVRGRKEFTAELGRVLQRHAF